MLSDYSKNDVAFEDADKALFLNAVHTFFTQVAIHERVDERLFELFCCKFDPKQRNPFKYELLKESIHPRECLFVDSLLKTNFFLPGRKAVSFRFDSTLLSSYKELFPEEIFALFYIYRDDFFGFHIRFQDIARGGLRTVIAREKEDIHKIAPTILSECYQLSWTQQKKNKDIPEGGAKAVLFVFPSCPLYTAQKEYIKSFLQIINMPFATEMIDEYKKPEYIYLGPDENMHDSMIDWIATYSKEVGYPPGIAFITGKTSVGINHKHYGVTSYGVTVCLDHVLRFLGYDPATMPFTVKMSGGPDGDVAGNEMRYLHTYYKKTAKLVGVIDVSGAVIDTQGLDLEACVTLFNQAQPISFYPKEKLSSSGMFVTLDPKRAIHQLEADIFIPAGGRPKTLNMGNIYDFLDDEGLPSSQAIIEGANVYLSQEARRFLEEKGLLIIKDSSANKGGVICSSFEVLSQLVLNEAEFIACKEQLAKEILEKIAYYAGKEVALILKRHKETKKPCSEISDDISREINSLAAALLASYADRSLTDEELELFFAYSLPLLRIDFKKRMIERVPDSHKKAIVATYKATHAVYNEFG